MKARIEKKLSKKLVRLAPSVLTGVWLDNSEPSVLAYKQRTSVSNVWSVGGGTDYFGDGMDAYTAWAWWQMNWEWHGDFETYPDGHEHQGYPDVSGFRSSTRNLLKLAVRAELGAKAEQERVRQSRQDLAMRHQPIPSRSGEVEPA